MRKTGRINELTITTKSENGEIDGNIMIQTERDMEVLANILSKKYNIHQMVDSADEYRETEFIMPRFYELSTLE